MARTTARANTFRRWIRPSSPTTSSRFGWGGLSFWVLAGTLVSAAVGRQTAKGDATPKPPTPRGWPINFAHRGGAKVVPEDTLEGLREGFAMGGRVVECDVHASAEGTVVVPCTRPFLTRRSISKSRVVVPASRRPCSAKSKPPGQSGRTLVVSDNRKEGHYRRSELAILTTADRDTGLRCRAPRNPRPVRLCDDASSRACEARAAISRPRSVGSVLYAPLRGHDQGRARGRWPRGESVRLARLEG